MLGSLLKPYRWTLLASAVLAVSAAALELVPHVTVYLAAVDALAVPSRLDRWWGLAALAFLGVVLRYVLLGTSAILSHSVAFRSLRDLRIRLLQGLATAPIATVEALAPGDVKKTLVEDVDAIEGVIAHNLPDLASAVVVPLLAFVALAWVDWRMALVSVALVPVAVLSIGAVFAGYEEQVARWHAAESRANSAMLEYLRGIQVLKAHHRDASSLTRVREAVHGIRDLAASMTRRTNTGYALFFTLLSSNLVVVLPFGVWMLQQDQIDPATLVLFLVLGVGITQPLLKLLFLFGTVQMNTVRLERLQELASLPRQGVAQRASVPSGHRIEVDGVGFTYDEERGAVLTGVGFTVEAGTVTALVGPSGSGKSTLLALLAGTRTPEIGEVRIGGVAIDGLSRLGRAGLVTMVAQQGWLFHGTLRENVALGRPSASQEELDEVARLARLQPVIDPLPRGWDTVVGERGSTLSGGEIQRVAIARALLLQSPVLLLDEVTAHLDANSEAEVQRALTLAARERTIVVVAHRLRTIRHADQIVVLDGGRVVGCGRHSELLEGCPTYRRLWEAQERAHGWTLPVAAPREVAR